ncbi:MAG TPA: hypothetical protein VF222_04395 [Nitrososphaeraceae archaeon]
MRYALNIQAAVLYGMLKPCIISGIAGSNIVSENITTKRVLLSKTRMNRAERLWITAVFVVVFCFSISFRRLFFSPSILEI